MKFKKLVDKAEKFANKLEHGKQVQPEKLRRLQELLEEKRDRYNQKLAATSDPDKHRSLETKLRVVNAQIAKSKQLIADTSVNEK